MSLVFHSWTNINYDLKVVGRGSNETCLVLNRSPLYVAFTFLDDRISV